VIPARSVHPLPGESERAARFQNLVDAFASRRLVVVGDIVADEFIYGRIARVSREAPVLILNYDSTEIVPGGAGNAATNAAALGGRVSLIGVIGTGHQDEPGQRLLDALPSGVDRRGLVKLAHYRTPVKTRILAGGIHSAKQQVVRIDRQNHFHLDAAMRQKIVARVDDAVGKADAVLISDYGSGLVTPLLVTRIVGRIRARTRRRRIPVLIDSRFALFDYQGLTAATPNEAEVEQLLDIRIGDDLNVLERAGRTVLRRTRMRAVLVTRGSRGMALFEPGRPTVHIPIFGSDQVTDVTGAGDTVIATMTLALAAGASFYEAARLANYAGGLVVMKRGTAAVSPAELASAVALDHPIPREPWSQEGTQQGRRS
jgi:rfaE bifunctional protein kinase chain/domain